MGHTIADFRNLLNQIEQISETIAKEYDVEHLAGPQGWALRFIAERSEVETFVKDIEAELRISKSVASNLVKRMEKMTLFGFYLLSLTDAISSWS